MKKMTGKEGYGQFTMNNLYKATLDKENSPVTNGSCDENGMTDCGTPMAKAFAPLMKKAGMNVQNFKKVNKGKY